MSMPYKLSDCFVDNVSSTLLDTVTRYIEQGGYRHLDIVTGFLWASGLNFVANLRGLERIQILSSPEFGPGVKESISLTGAYSKACSSSITIKVWDSAQKLHAKCYLLSNSSLNKAPIAIIGSSNLTLNGLREQLELNHVITEGNRIEEIGRWFNSLFSVAKAPSATDIHVIDRETSGKVSSDQSWDNVIPWCLQYKNAFLDWLGNIDTGNASKLYSPIQGVPHQEDAVNQVWFRLRQVGCCFLADDVGLGKTLMAAGVAQRYMERLQRSETYQVGQVEVIVLMPKATRKQWAKHLNSAAKELNFRIPPIRGFTYGQEHRLDADESFAATGNSASLIIIDEAHRIRNDVEMYRSVSELIRNHFSNGRRPDILFLTATPINNAFTDLANLFELGLPPAFWGQLGISDVKNYLRRIDKEYCTVQNTTDRQILVSPLIDSLKKIMVRRNADYIEQNYILQSDDVRRRVRLPKLANNQVEMLSVSPSADSVVAIESIIKAINEINFEAYCLAGTYSSNSDQLKSDIQSNMRVLLRGHLAKLAQSSFSAALVSLERITAHSEEISRTGELAVFSKLAEHLSGDLDYTEVAENSENEASVVDESELQLWKQRLDKDKSRMDHLLGLLRRHRDTLDGEKLNAIDFPPGAAPTLVFTEYRATAEFLVQSLRKKGISVFPFVTDAELDSKEAETELLRLDPSEDSPLRAEAPNYSVYVLLDRYSEGKNLQKANRLIHFDLPWNPVRKIQRQGRIQRMESPHTEIYVASVRYCSEHFSSLADVEGVLKEKLVKLAAVFGAGENDDLVAGQRKFIAYNQKLMGQLVDQEAQTLLRFDMEEDFRSVLQMQSVLSQSGKPAIDKARSVIRDLENCLLKQVPLVCKGPEKGWVCLVEKSLFHPRYTWLVETEGKDALKRFSFEEFINEIGHALSGCYPGQPLRSDERIALSLLGTEGIPTINDLLQRIQNRLQRLTQGDAGKRNIVRHLVIRLNEVKLQVPLHMLRSVETELRRLTSASDLQDFIGEKIAELERAQASKSLSTVIACSEDYFERFKSELVAA